MIKFLHNFLISLLLISAVSACNARESNYQRPYDSSDDKAVKTLGTEERKAWCYSRHLRGAHALHDCLNGNPTFNNKNFAVD